MLSLKRALANCYQAGLSFETILKPVCDISMKENQLMRKKKIVENPTGFELA